MSDTREHDSQSTPVPNANRPIADLVCEDIQRRAEHGKRKYGTKLQAHNGRNAMQDGYEEILDLACYMRQKIAEDENTVKGRVRSCIAMFRNMAIEAEKRDPGKWKAVNELYELILSQIEDSLED